MKRLIKFIATHLIPNSVLEILCEDTVKGLKEKNTDLIQQLKPLNTTHIGEMLKVIHADNSYDVKSMSGAELHEVYIKHMDLRAGRMIYTYKDGTVSDMSSIEGKSLDYSTVYDSRGFIRLKIRIGVW